MLSTWGEVATYDPTDVLEVFSRNRHIKITLLPYIRIAVDSHVGHTNERTWERKFLAWGPASHGADRGYERHPAAPIPQRVLL